MDITTNNKIESNTQIFKMVKTLKNLTPTGSEMPRLKISDPASQLLVDSFVINEIISKNRSMSACTRTCLQAFSQDLPIKT